MNMLTAIRINGTATTPESEEFPIDQQEISGVRYTTPISEQLRYHYDHSARINSIAGYILRSLATSYEDTAKKKEFSHLFHAASLFRDLAQEIQQAIAIDTRSSWEFEYGSTLPKVSPYELEYEINPIASIPARTGRRYKFVISEQRMAYPERAPIE